jgi:hypothetical protein
LPRKPIVEPQGGTIAPVATPPGAFISMTGYCYDVQADYAYRSNFCAKGDRIITAEEYASDVARGRSIPSGAQ